MHVFITGGSGWVGSHVVPELLAHGHTVTALARSDDAAAKLEAAGCKTIRGDLHDHNALREGSRSTDGTIHCAFIHDFTKMEEMSKIDLAAVTAMSEGLEGTNKPLLICSAPLGKVPEGETRPMIETDAGDASTVHLGNFRVHTEDFVTGLASKGVRSVVVRLPTSVHGTGDKAFIPMLISNARTKGYSPYIEQGTARWAAAHVKDVAVLFRIALENDSLPAGSRIHAVGDGGIPYKSIAEAIATGLGIEARSIPADKAQEEMGWLAIMTRRDRPMTAELTKTWLGWEPTHSGLLEDLAERHYFEEKW
jgi:nucleoside-diphosphate-sugar epimerase